MNIAAYLTMSQVATSDVCRARRTGADLACRPGIVREELPEGITLATWGNGA